MPTPKNSLAKARLTGAAAHDPQRYRDRTEPRTSGEAVGSAPSYLSKTSKAVWADLAGSLGWLQREDRGALELVAVAIGQVRDLVKAGEPVPAALLSAANTGLGKLGATPADRAKVGGLPEDDVEEDVWAQFETKGAA